MNYLYEIGQKVVYRGLIATIENRWISTNNESVYDLIADKDPELSCSANEKECVLYDGNEIDELPALSMAYLESHRIQKLGESLTDKNFRDGCH